MSVYKTKNQYNLEQILSEIPNMTSDIYYSYLENLHRRPRFDMVFKKVKEKLKFDGIDYIKCSKYDQEEIINMAYDVFCGLREAGD